jgi:hypothetical protein
VFMIVLPMLVADNGILALKLRSPNRGGDAVSRRWLGIRGLVVDVTVLHQPLD